MNFQIWTESYKEKLKEFFSKLNVEFKIQHWHMMAICILVGFGIGRLAFWLGGVIYLLLKELVKWLFLN